VGYLFAILGSITGFLCVGATTVAFLPGNSDIQLILGGVYGIATAVFWVGAGIIFRMDDYHSKKDTPK
jgi:hypothetical protein